MPKTAVIIVTYNAMKWADKCFASLRQSMVPLEVFVIDNGSADGTQDYIKQNFPEVNFYQSDVNLGFGKANNLGIEKAYRIGAEFFYLMNQDAWIFPESIEKLLQVYDNYTQKNEIGILSPMHLDGTEKKLDIFLDKYIAHNFEKTRLISDLYFQTLKSFYEIQFVNAAHWFLPKKTIETVGGFNPYFFHYGEDAEYVNRVKFHQKKILLVPASKAVHDGKQQLDKVNYEVYEDLGIETNILNPNLPKAFLLEKKSLKQSLIKNLLLGNISVFQSLNTKLKKISAEEKILAQMADEVKKSGLTFLNM